MTHNAKRLGLAVGAVVVTLGVAAGLSASSQNTSGVPGPFMGRRGGPGGPGMGGAILGPIQMIASQLGLSDAQKDQIKAMAQSHRDEWRALAENMNAAQQALRAAITAGTFDETLIRDKSAAVGQAEADIAVASARAFNEIFQNLTPDQQTKLRALQAQRPPRGPQARGRGRGF